MAGEREPADACRTLPEGYPKPRESSRSLLFRPCASLANRDLCQAQTGLIVQEIAKVLGISRETRLALPQNLAENGNGRSRTSRVTRERHMRIREFLNPSSTRSALDPHDPWEPNSLQAYFCETAIE
jgi:hypothetical protein